MKHVLKLQVMGLLLVLLSMGYVKAQSSNGQQVQVTDLSNPSLDAAGYDAVKAEFVKQNPEQYKALSGNAAEKAGETAVYPWGADENKHAWVTAHPREYAAFVQGEQDNRTRMSRSELNKMPAEKQQSILNDSNFIIIE
jgi:hypothetical protein